MATAVAALGQAAMALVVVGGGHRLHVEAAVTAVTKHRQLARCT